MAESLSLEFNATLTANTEVIVANDGKVLHKQGKGPQGVDTQNARRVTIILVNKSTTQDVTFRIKPGPGKLDPDTGQRIFVTETNLYTQIIPAGQQAIVDIAVYHPFYIVTAQSAAAGSHPVVVYFDAYIQDRG